MTEGTFIITDSDGRSTQPLKWNITAEELNGTPLSFPEAFQWPTHERPRPYDQERMPVIQ